MTKYLAIITTVLVLTQIIRLCQNWLQLRRMKNRVENQDEQILRIWDKLDTAIECYLRKEGWK